jgi:hypothetical protein
VKKEKKAKTVKAAKAKVVQTHNVIVEPVAEPPVIPMAESAENLVALATAMLKAGYNTNGTAATLRKMADALATQLALPLAQPEAVALHVVQAAYPKTVGTPASLKKMADVLRPRFGAKHEVA